MDEDREMPTRGSPSLPDSPPKITAPPCFHPPSCNLGTPASRPALEGLRKSTLCPPLKGPQFVGIKT